MRTIYLRTNFIKTRPSRKAFIAINSTLLILFAAVFILPYLHVLAQSLSDGQEVMRGNIGLFPRSFTLENYRSVIGDSLIWSSLTVTTARVLLGSAIALIVQYMAAYALLKKNLWCRKVFVIFLTIPMFISGGVISNYVIYNSIKIYNTFFVYIFPSAFSFYNMVIIRTYLKSLSDTFVEAARIDGAGELVVLFRIMMPLSKPIIATILIWTIVGYWNDWTTSLYYVNSKSLWTLQYYLHVYLTNAQQTDNLLKELIAQGALIGDYEITVSAQSIQSTQIIFASLPIVIAYPFFQKYFSKGVVIGGIKE
jgi:putative aldouronate transport system permease protein